MKTLKEIQDEVAKDNHLNEWRFLSSLKRDTLWPEVCRRAQLECGKATLEKTWEKVELIHCGVKMEQAVTSEENIVIIK